MDDLALVGKEIRFCVAADRGIQDELHSRFIFSKEGGVNLDRGLQTKASKFEISYIDRETHMAKWKMYAERPWPFDLVVDETCRVLSTIAADNPQDLNS